jgi:AbrB family looped-hinge helix DNA binding protein
MKATIGKAGRVVIPAHIRATAGLEPGSEVDVTADELGVHLVRSAPGPRLVKVGRRTVVRPTAPAGARPAVDVGALIDEERDRWPL